MTAILLAPALVTMTSNSVFSSTGAGVVPGVAVPTAATGGGSGRLNIEFFF